MKTVLFHAREAGVANMLLALEPPLKSHGYKIIYDVDDYASAILLNNKTGPIKDADIVLCGYDCAEVDRTGEFLRKVNGHIPTLGLLDSWNGLKRFWRKDGGLRLLTDRLIVPDDGVREYLLAHGIPSDFPVVAGHPGLERVQNYTDRERLELRCNIRNMLGISLDKRIVLLLSEEFQLPDGERVSLLDAKINDGRSVKQWLTDEAGDEYKLAVRLHPVEKINIPEGWIDACDIELSLALSMVDKVVGLGSTAIAYAIAFGVIVKSLDKHVSDWKPEYSGIPSDLWNGLVRSGIYQNEFGIGKAGSCNIFSNSADRIIAEMIKLLKKYDSTIC